MLQRRLGRIDIDCCKIGVWTVLLLLTGFVALSAEVSSNLAGKEIKSKVPISISSKRMTVNNPDQIMVFEGDVRVIKGDLTLTSNHVKIYFLNSKSGEKGKTEAPSLTHQEISLIEAEGNVHMTRGNREAKADKAEYRQDEEIIILTGSPEGWDNQYKVSGTKMTIYLKQDRSVVEGSHVVFTP